MIKIILTVVSFFLFAGVAFAIGIDFKELYSFTPQVKLGEIHIYKIVDNDVWCYESVSLTNSSISCLR